MANNTKITKTKAKKPAIQFSNVKQNFKKKKKNTTETVVSGTNKGKSRKPKIKKHAILSLLMSFMILCAFACLAFCLYIIITCPEFDTSRLYKTNSSVVEDMNGNVIAELGVEKRENVTYDQLPDVLIDAIIATEDSKFFQHDGIDLLRFGKATIGQLLGQDNAGGGSTLTMQIVKNTYNGTEAHGIAGILRKFRDIYMAVFKVEKSFTKQEILEFYVNQGYLGNSTGGVEQASQIYFGKSVSEINLAEASLLAGLFQAPTAYDPYQYPEKAEARRNQVLNLMVRHGYITKEEADIAKAIKVESMLTGYSYSYSEYQGFLTTLVSDVIKKTGNNPYVVAMKIRSTLNPDKQKVINDLYNGKTNYKWVNELVQCGIAVTDVKNGAVVAVGAGRNRTGERQYNYATDIKRHPGSTAKPIFDYGPAIEYAGWGTGTTIVDDVYTYSNKTPINNVNRSYNGIMTAKTALAQSRNIPALQAFQATSQENKYEFVTGLGITPELSNGQIMESASIGAFTGTNPMELSAAYGAFSRGGYYIEPYTFTKIEYLDSDNSTFVYTPNRTKVMSEETAYMINMILKYAVTSGAIGVGTVSGTDVASKTGTSSEDQNKIKQLHLSSSTIKDSWQVAYSPDYSIAFWYGYDSNTKEHYLTSNEGWNARRGIVRVLAPKILEKNSRWSQPSGVTQVTVELETIPTQLASENTPDNLKSSEYFRKGTEPTEVSSRFATLENVSNLSSTTVGNQVQLSWNPIATPEAIDQGYLQTYFNTNYVPWSEKYYQKRLEYNNAYVGTVIYEIYQKVGDSMLLLGTTPHNSFTTNVTSTTSVTFVVKSTYTINKSCASSGREITVKITPSFDPSTQGGTTTTPTDDDDDDNTTTTPVD